MNKVLLLGSGPAGIGRQRRIKVEGKTTWEGQTVISLDINPHHKPDIIHDLNVLPWPFVDNEFDEVAAYEVLEHLGALGDERSLFAHFGEIYRILKPGGKLSATVPGWANVWAFGDPSHRRIINSGTLTFLNQMEYINQVGRTPMSDFRYIWKGDFECRWLSFQKTVNVGGELKIMGEDTGKEGFGFIVEAIKPSRIGS